MNRHSYTVLEFDKLREEISNYSAIEENHYKILGLEPFKDFSSLNRELDLSHCHSNITIYEKQGVVFTR